MISATLTLALALCAQTPVGVSQAPRRSVSDERLKAFEEFYENLNRQSQSVLGGNFTSTRAGVQVGVAPAPKTYTVTFPNTGTNFAERVLVGLPDMAQVTSPAPVMVMFHGYNRTEGSCYVDGGDLFAEAQSRGFFVIAPLGAHTRNYGIDYAQDNIEFALTFLMANLPIDPQRVYGVGFSMGGGGVLSYGARHMDPTKPRFAAIVNHTGGTSTSFVYWNSAEQNLFDHPQFFGGSPAAFPFRYSTASTVDIDFATRAIDPATDLARNLHPVPVLNYHAEFDPNLNLVLATQLIHSWFGLNPGMETYLLTPSLNDHLWSTMNENIVLNFLYSKTLATPTDGVHRVLADRDARWHHFSVTQDGAGAFTPFRWNFEPAANRVTIDETENLQNIKVHCADLGLDTAQNLQVLMSTTDGSAESTTLTGYASMPTGVLRGGLVTQDWTWDSPTQTVTLTELIPDGTAWEITP
jgi:pimeloyl-ACP methyl ester carboxylesterase